MKENTQKLLMWLHQPHETQAQETSKNKQVSSQRTIEYDQLRLLLLDLTPGGRRSLIHHLSRKHLIRSERLPRATGRYPHTQLSLTPHGATALATQFPVFATDRENWAGEWSALIFLQAPSSDPHFRYLRALLLDHRAFQLRRGVYLHPGQFPAKIIDTCRDLYVGQVVITELAEWLFGDERSTINDHFMLSDLMSIYSGISSEINQLLTDKNQQKGLTDKFQRRIFSVFDRLFTALSQDVGLLGHYYPSARLGFSNNNADHFNTKIGLKLLAQLKSLLTSDF